MTKIHNFNAGPSILPQEVMKKASEAALNLDNSGLSILEISHRSAAFKDIMKNARNLVRELLDVPDNYTVLFLQGGASLGFYMTALNLMKQEGGKAAYVDTGSWSSKAIKEAELLGEINVIASSENNSYKYIPKNFQVPPDSDYLHLTSNNTIHGTQFHDFPTTKAPVVCDMSSDIFSRPLNVSNFDIIYAGAQKNMGPAGTTLYIVNKDVLGKTGRKIPKILDFEVHDSKDSVYNTAPVFPIYTSMLVLQWIRDQGGVKAMEERNRKKAELLYNEIDSNPMFEGVAEKEDRSLMNVTFVPTDDTHMDEFDKMWQEAGIIGLNGHRSVGGYRASIYNALPFESVEVLVEIMKKFSKKHSKTPA